jgi:CheY-like chemotaxis protein
MPTGPGTESSSPLVLIVEDDLATRSFYRDVLTLSGFRTADAHNGHQALEKARDERPNLVLTDLAVPGMDGFELCRALRQSAHLRDIPILAVTGHAEYLGDAGRFRQAGIDQVLMKPCPPDLIVQEVRRLLHETHRGAAALHVPPNGRR